MKRLFRWLLRLTLVGLLLGILAFAITYALIVPKLPSVDNLKAVQLQVPLRIFTADGKLIDTFGEKRRVPVTIAEVPEPLKQAFLAGEDARFYEHPGVDYQGISRAVWTLLRTGEKSIGGSTITQQLARNFYLSFEKTYARKLKEIFLALKIERELSKDEILELYLNKIFLGHRAYGVGAAAEVYYGKTLDELSLAQSAMIAALPKAPSRINPISSPERALQRRDYVLGRMHELEFITQSQYNAALGEKDLAFYHGGNSEVSAAYVAEMARAEALKMFGEDAYSGGYNVYTTITGANQTAAIDAVQKGLFDYDQRHGYRGPEAHIDLAAQATTEDWDRSLRNYRPIANLLPGLVTEVDAEAALVYLQDGQSIALNTAAIAWAKPFVNRDQVGDPPENPEQVLTPGDIIRVAINDTGEWTLQQLPEAQAALISIDSQDGAIAALVGGFDFAQSKFNRVLQARRQPGSSFKPFIYSAALDKGFNPASMVNDAPVVFEDKALEKTWKPQNFSERFYGPTRLREAMVNSRNLVSIRLLRDVGIRPAQDHISKFGFKRDQLPPDLSMSLGSATLTPISVARGYAVFANSGYLVEPYLIARIENSAGETIYQATPSRVCPECALSLSSTTTEPMQDSTEEAGEAPEFTPAERVISAQNAYLIRSMMSDVVRRGTGKLAMSLERNDLAGKTGTTNDQRDAWFSGYNSDLVTTVWVGFDDPQHVLGRGELGGKAALPIWIDYMAVALTESDDRLPAMPNGLVQARINPETGLLAAPGTGGTILEVFAANNMPAMEEQPLVFDNTDPDAPAIVEDESYGIF